MNAPGDKHWLIVDFRDDHWADKLDLPSFRLIEDFELIAEDPPGDLAFTSRTHGHQCDVLIPAQFVEPCAAAEALRAIREPYRDSDQSWNISCPGQSVENAFYQLKHLYSHLLIFTGFE